jgi:hypothetical protein
MEVVGRLKSDHSTTKRLCLLSAMNVVKSLVKSVVRDVDVDVVEDVAIEGAGVLLETWAESILTPSLELCFAGSANDTKWRDFASSVTRRDTVSSSARS